MKTILTLVLVSISAIVGSFGGAAFVDKHQTSNAQKSKAERGSLKWRVEEAKAQGKKEIIVPTPIPLLAEVYSVDDALSRYTVVLAEPIGKATRVQDDYNLQTIYKFKVVETLTTKKPECPGCLSDIEVPNMLKDLEQDEILVSRSGGIINLNGVTVINKSDDFPEFVPGQKYLLFLSLDPVRKLGTANFGQFGVFKVEDDILESISSKDHPVKNDLQKQYKKSLKKLKESIKEKKNAHHVVKDDNPKGEKR